LKCCIYWKIVCRNRITEYGRKTQQNESGSYEGRKKDQKENMIKAINSVVKGVASKTTMPILEGILIQTNDNEVKLTTYDLELGIEYVIECDVKEQGSTVVNATMFSEIIRKLPDTEIYITLNEKNILEISAIMAMAASSLRRLKM